MRTNLMHARQGWGVDRLYVFLCVASVTQPMQRCRTRQRPSIPHLDAGRNARLVYHRKSMRCGRGCSLCHATPDGSLCAVAEGTPSTMQHLASVSPARPTPGQLHRSKDAVAEGTPSAMRKHLQLHGSSAMQHLTAVYALWPRALPQPCAT